MDENRLNLEYGNPDHLTGNAFTYWHIRAVSEDEVLDKFVVTNFMVSPLLFNRHTIAATFPPLIFDSKEEFFEIARHASIDIIKMEEVTIPREGFNFSRFFKKELSRFNKVVTHYSVLYTQLINEERDEDVEEEAADEISQLNRLSSLAQEAHEAFTIAHNKAQARDTVIKMRRIAHALNAPNFKYDIENLIALLSVSDERVEELSRLYYRKFLAISGEQYEDAEKLKRKIDQISENIEEEI